MSPGAPAGAAKWLKTGFAQAAAAQGHERAEAAERQRGGKRPPARESPVAAPPAPSPARVAAQPRRRRGVARSPSGDGSGRSEPLRHGQLDAPSPPALIGVRRAAAALCGSLGCQSAGSHSRGRRTAPCGAEGGGAAAAERRRGTSLHLPPAQLGAGRAVCCSCSCSAFPLAEGRRSRAGNRPAGAPQRRPCRGRGAARGLPGECGSDTCWAGEGRVAAPQTRGRPGGKRRAAAAGAGGGGGCRPVRIPPPRGHGRSPALRGKAAAGRAAQRGLVPVRCGGGALASGSSGVGDQVGASLSFGFPREAWISRAAPGGRRKAFGSGHDAWVGMGNFVFSRPTTQMPPSSADAVTLPRLLAWAAPCHLTHNSERPRQAASHCSGN
ncbi:collagen alpha-2(I) chain-like [Strigops habroptila]|uniref:collagen alpha-2(I) chain-like n=1 Tax=Strigops habroptila TaxID=2489341 RepID=UPI0011CFFFAC|nr:collagen alpha-2(I) chain-like [Strigops habroptila]